MGMVDAVQGLGMKGTKTGASPRMTGERPQRNAAPHLFSSPANFLSGFLSCQKIPDQPTGQFIFTTAKKYKTGHPIFLPERMISPKVVVRIVWYKTMTYGFSRPVFWSCQVQVTGNEMDVTRTKNVSSI
jgi:hypothetical protein